jgi:uncharacterized membrane protein YdbT with pleckstrin-like domain
VAGLLGWLDPKVDRYVLDEAGERKVLEVRKHWVVLIFPAFRVLLALVIFTFVVTNEGPVALVLFLLAAAIITQALWRLVEEFRDRFVITNQRVFRVHGTFSTSRASVPLSRILDITVKKPLTGHWFGYGHFVFESAAQVQGLNEIRYVGKIDYVEDRLRMAMQGDVPQVSVIDDDDGT